MVNLPNVEKICDAFPMETTGKTLIALKERTGLSLQDIAKAAGYRGASSIQRYFNDDFEDSLSPKVAEKLAKAMVGLGRPAVTAQEMSGLSDYSKTEPQINLVTDQLAGAFVWHVARTFGVDVQRNDRQVLRLARFLPALLKLSASREVSDAEDLVAGLFAGAAVQSQIE